MAEVLEERKMKSLLDVYHFGAIDADNDDLLLDCFEDHEAFLSVRTVSAFWWSDAREAGRQLSSRTCSRSQVMTISASVIRSLTILGTTTIFRPESAFPT